jgi:osmoprotectant transport system ATP-binding protein
MLHLRNVSKRYGERLALAPTDLECSQGTTTVLIGPSGCGKSTLLRMVAGLVVPDTGSVEIAGQVLSRENAETLRRRLGYVIQDGGLFPHLSARDNVALVARFLKMPTDKIDQRIAALGALVRLDEAALRRFPKELSGGQRQRVGVMRALMLDPPLVLLDEPLGALDPITRGELQTELKEIFRQFAKTVLLVTHDMAEAAHFGDTIALMRDGRIVQRGTLADLIERPSEPYVRAFVQAQRSPLSQL